MSDDAPAIPHPRETTRLFGHGEAAATLASALESGRMAHAWMLSGPRGIGKATLAYRAARFVLAGAEPLPDLLGEGAPLSTAEDHPVVPLVANRAHPNLRVLSTETSTGKGREVVVDDVRAMAPFIRGTAADGGWRVVIVDSIDDFNRNAANALLKFLEEPPAKCLFLLVNHAIGTVLPTIRSRCRLLRMRPLEGDDFQATVAALLPDIAGNDLDLLAEMAQGSPGRAVALVADKGLTLRRDVAQILEASRTVDRGRLLAFADRFARAEALPGFRLVGEILGGWLAERAKLLARRGGAGSAQSCWDVWEAVGRLFLMAEARNLDRKQVILDAFLRVEAAGIAGRAD